MNEIISQWLYRIFGNDPTICTFVASFIPIMEMKGSIALGVSSLWDTPLSPIASASISLLGATIITAFLLFVFSLIFKIFSLNQNFSCVQATIQNSFDSKCEQIRALNTTKKKLFALALFTLIPIPLTGYYSASLIAVLCGLPPFQSLFAISIGNIVCAFILMFVVSISAVFATILLYIFAIIFVILSLYFTFAFFMHKNHSKH